MNKSTYTSCDAFALMRSQHVSVSATSGRLSISSVHLSIEIRISSNNIYVNND